jgi:hypothetical protein
VTPFVTPLEGTMTQIDPLKLVRNPATLEAYRQHQRAVRAAAQPWLIVAVVAVFLEIGLFLYGLLRQGFRDLSLLSGLLIMVFGLAFFVAALRAWLYQRAHPFELPETLRPPWR